MVILVMFKIEKNNEGFLLAHFIPDNKTQSTWLKLKDCEKRTPTV